MIAVSPEIELVIKPHTRCGGSQPLTKYSPLYHLLNVSVARGDTHSIHLLNLADVYIDLATPVAFEAVNQRKPVLTADYLHAERSALSCFMP